LETEEDHAKTGEEFVDNLIQQTSAPRENDNENENENENDNVEVDVVVNVNND
jgi:hypothetical protein